LKIKRPGGVCQNIYDNSKGQLATVETTRRMRHINGQGSAGGNFLESQFAYGFQLKCHMSCKTV